jgi:hypothetical protein
LPAPSTAAQKPAVGQETEYSDCPESTMTGDDHVLPL